MAACPVVRIDRAETFFQHRLRQPHQLVLHVDDLIELERNRSCSPVSRFSRGLDTAVPSIRRPQNEESRPQAGGNRKTELQKNDGQIPPIRQRQTHDLPQSVSQINGLLIVHGRLMIR